MNRVLSHLARWLGALAVMQLVFLMPFVALGVALGARSIDDLPRWIAVAGVAALVCAVVLAGNGGAALHSPTTARDLQGSSMQMAAMTAEYAWKEQEAQHAKAARTGDDAQRLRAFTGRWDHLTAGLLAVTGLALLVEAWALLLRT